MEFLDRIVAARLGEPGENVSGRVRVLLVVAPIRPTREPHPISAPHVVTEAVWQDYHGSIVNHLSARWTVAEVGRVLDRTDLDEAD